VTLRLPATFPAVGATLVVARPAHCIRRRQGDHKGRPYIILRVGVNRAFTIGLNGSLMI